MDHIFNCINYFEFVLLIQSIYKLLHKSVLFFAHSLHIFIFNPIFSHIFINAIVIIYFLNLFFAVQVVFLYFAIFCDNRQLQIALFSLFIVLHFAKYWFIHRNCILTDAIDLFPPTIHIIIILYIPLYISINNTNNHSNVCTNNHSNVGTNNDNYCEYNGQSELQFMHSHVIGHTEPSRQILLHQFNLGNIF